MGCVFKKKKKGTTAVTVMAEQVPGVKDPDLGC